MLTITINTFCIFYISAVPAMVQSVAVVSTVGKNVQLRTVVQLQKMLTLGFG
jgi:hypothetical protein